ncbi:Small, acid-soluble spore protein, alpha/beta type [Proteiniborus ethanoligenes]|uniref:Small, acid-soluble spore protein, alpha/beta type n=1 Tax=Proteiniborus ethanoligenes TaxID=415015 RepID=A0A1H3PB05_9FIRM|nr:small, acid-soluble spore protein, alpha/beta type [Proteiniborus ethanoligenes]TAH59784.1 MAG: small, acid-soluble spore protein, alpha/beta type [Gottschalkiaceae bacterium]SDY98005.1 Small, acid-soluble spore protein, alpha/beta type [Proteiniborus ethanoligenes]
MKNNKVSPKAREAFQSFKEEMAKDMEIELRDRDDHITKMVDWNKVNELNHLGRS